MNEATAKKQLLRMLNSYTAGAVLHFLGDIYRERAEEARRASDAPGHEQYKMIEAALFVVGIGVDGACPR